MKRPEGFQQIPIYFFIAMNQLGLIGGLGPGGLDSWDPIMKGIVS